MTPLALGASVYVQPAAESLPVGSMLSMLPGVIRAFQPGGRYAAIEFPYVPPQDSYLMWDCQGLVPSGRGRFIELSMLVLASETPPRLALQSRRLRLCIRALGSAYPVLAGELGLVWAALETLIRHPASPPPDPSGEGEDSTDEPDTDEEEDSSNEEES